MTKEISIVWFRKDLRLSDNSALLAASEIGEILGIYILDDCAPNSFKIGSASKVWLHTSLSKLNESLNNKLNLYVGKSSEIIKSLIKRHDIKNIFWNISYEPWHLKQENEVKYICNQASIKYEAFNSNYLWNPTQILKEDGTYYKVFTAYKNKSNSFTPRASINIIKRPNFIKDHINSTNLSDLDLLPKNKWHKIIERSWDNIGETGAKNHLDIFIKNHLFMYKDDRNYPAKDKTSKLSPHLHFGEISPSQIYNSIHIAQHLEQNKNNIESFFNELIWREFSNYLLYHFSRIHSDNFNTKFNQFSWSNNSQYLKAWQTGNTGYPLIDAGMRQLWQTGYMHNRVRMVVGSFLVKNLNIHWHNGRDWFWDCLVDADLANNSANWQWVTGCGVDAAPYFRIFNPIAQGEKFDKNGEYTKKFIPELKNMPSEYLFKPWKTPESLLKSAGVVLGLTYPKPIVNFENSRDRALELYKIIKNSH